jgi:hypothetical protein
MRIGNGFSNLCGKYFVLLEISHLLIRLGRIESGGMRSIIDIPTPHSILDARLASSFKNLATITAYVPRRIYLLFILDVQFLNLEFPLFSNFVSTLFLLLQVPPRRDLMALSRARAPRAPYP